MLAYARFVVERIFTFVHKQQRAPIVVEPVFVYMQLLEQQQPNYLWLLCEDRAAVAKWFVGWSAMTVVWVQFPVEAELSNQYCSGIEPAS